MSLNPKQQQQQKLKPEALWNKERESETGRLKKKSRKNQNQNPNNSLLLSLSRSRDSGWTTDLAILYLCVRALAPVLVCRGDQVSHFFFITFDLISFVCLLLGPRF